ncbi:MAG: 2-oxo acid dehydrogenase subunit E2 [Sedimentisphaerales bacterium]|nr:2-oxo acid dehydrogenase subunit E2 [Sedimentisphaerales bacterium]
MAKEIRLPKLGQTMEEATIIACRVKLGDKIERGDYIFEIETDKATLEMESPTDGFVKRILGRPGQTVHVGAPLLVLGEKDERVLWGFLDSIKTSVAAQPTRQKIDALVEPPAAADEHIPASGIDNEVQVKETIPLTKKQKLTAEKMLQSKREIPSFYLTVRADVTSLVDLRTRLNETAAVKISYNDFFIKAVAIGLHKFPLLTGRLVDDAVKIPDAVNIGLAVAAPDGLVVPVIKDAHKKDLNQIAADSAALIEKAQSGKLLLTDLEGACITISNLGTFGVNSFIPIVIPGQCSILGIGRITDTCVSGNGGVVIRKLINITISVDHRIANGAYAAEFLDFTRKLLEDTSTFI